MNKEDIKSLVKLILILLTGLATVPLTGGLSIILAIPFTFFIYIGVSLFGKKISSILINPTLNEIRVFKKMGRKTIRLKDDYLREPKGIKGALLIFSKIFLINFIAVALITKYLGPTGIPESVGEALHAFLLSTILSVFFAAIVSPIGIGLYVLDNSPIRIFNPSEGLIEKPGWLVRKVYKALFGYGNLIVLVYLLIDSINYAQGQVGAGLTVFFVFIALVYGSISLSAIVSAILIIKFNPKVLASLLSEFTEMASKETISPDETVELFKKVMGLEVHEEESREESGEVLQETGQSEPI
ncbi:MAG: hypothetical protein Q6351_004635 [Candidatus Njordarchaeum guaymaensis]